MSLDVLVGLLGGVFISWFFYFLQSRKKKNIRKKLRDLDDHIEYVSRLRGSNEYLFGMAFFSVFLAFFLIALGLAIPSLTSYLLVFKFVPGAETIARGASAVCFLVAALVAFTEARIFRDFSNFEKALKNVEDKKDKLKQALDDA